MVTAKLDALAALAWLRMPSTLLWLSWVNTNWLAASQGIISPTSFNAPAEQGTMRFGSSTKGLAKRMLKYYRISCSEAQAG